MPINLSFLFSESKVIRMYKDNTCKYIAVNASVNYASSFEEAEGDIGFGFSIQTSVHPCIHLWHIFMHAISFEPFMLGFWNFIYEFLMEK